MDQPAPTPTITPPSPQPTYTPITPTPPPKSPFFFIILIIALAIIGYTGYNLMKSWGQRPTLLPHPALPTVTVSTQSAEVKTEVEVEPDQSTFQNQAYTFNYPREATVEPFNPQEGIGTVVSIKGPTQRRDTEFYDGLLLRFQAITDIGDQDLQAYVNAKIEQSKTNGIDVTSGPTYTSVNGNSGYKYTETGLGTFNVYYIQSFDGSKTIEITDGTTDPTDQGYVDMAHDILDSFDFVN